MRLTFPPRGEVVTSDNSKGPAKVRRKCRGSRHVENTYTKPNSASCFHGFPNVRLLYYDGLSVCSMWTLGLFSLVHQRLVLVLIWIKPDRLDPKYYFCVLPQASKNTSSPSRDAPAYLALSVLDIIVSNLYLHIIQRHVPFTTFFFVSLLVLSNPSCLWSYQ